MPLQTFEHGGEATDILGPDPVQFEAVGHKQSEALLVIRDLRSQGFDPGVELLFGQLAGQLFQAGLPQTLAGVHLKFRGESL
jgi:hypothetical protein